MIFSHLAFYKEIFKNKGQVTLPNIFPESQAEEIWKAYIKSDQFKVTFFNEEFNCKTSIDQNGILIIYQMIPKLVIMVKKQLKLNPKSVMLHKLVNITVMLEVS